MKIISGGQTGADQAALDAAISLHIAHGGWVPKGRKTEQGPLPRHYTVEEMRSANYRHRTEKNILTADGTLIFSFGPLSGGSALTKALAIRHDKPFLHIDFEQLTTEKAINAIEQWLRKEKIDTVNIAGSRASSEPRIYQAVYSLLVLVHWPQTPPPSSC